MTRPQVVIVGAGTAGLTAAAALRDRPWRRQLVDVVVVDERNHHTWGPMLYRVAAGRARPDTAAQTVTAAIRRLPNVAFRQARVVAIQPRMRRVETDRGPVSYDYLIVAAGNVDDDRRRLGPMLGVANLAQAVEVRDRIVACRQEASWADRQDRARLLTVAVVGGGATGLELAAVLAAGPGRCGKGRGNGRTGRSPGRLGAVKVVVVESGDTPAGVPAGLAAPVVRALADRGVDVRLGATAAQADDTGVDLTDGSHVDAATVIWAGGVRANPLAGLFAATGSHGRVLVGDTLQIDHYPEIFVAGDMAERTSPGGRRPMTSALAERTGRHAATSVLRTASGLDAKALARHARLPRPFMLSVGPLDAVGNTGPFRLRGLIGKAVWLALHVLAHPGRRHAALAIRWALHAIRPAAPNLIAIGPVRAPKRGEPVDAMTQVEPPRVDLPSINVGNANDFGRAAALSWWTSELPNQPDQSGPPPGPLAAVRSRVLRIREAAFGIKSDTTDDYST